MDDINYPRLFKSGLEHRNIVIDKNPFTIGSSFRCDYIIPNQVISSLHCQFEKNGNQWFLRDSSANGTLINGTLIRASLSSPLNQSDEIQLSPNDYKFVFKTGPTNGFTDEQLCMIADSAQADIVTAMSPAPVSNTAPSDNDNSNESIDFLSEYYSPVYTRDSRPRGDIDVTDNSNVQFEGPSTSTSRGRSSSTYLTRATSSSSIETNMDETEDEIVLESQEAIQNVSTTEDPSIVQNETSSSSVETYLDETEYQRFLESQAMAIQNVSTTEHPSIVQNETSSSGIETNMDQTDYQRFLESQKMAIQSVSTTEDPSIVKNETSSSGIETNMDQTEYQRFLESQKQPNQMDDELLCAICSEMFVKATTLNCAHTFCKMCVDKWKQKHSFCPICRARITSQVGTFVLDNMIEKVVQSSSTEVQEHRKELLEERIKLSQSKQPKPRVPDGPYSRQRDISNIPDDLDDSDLTE